MNYLVKVYQHNKNLSFATSGNDGNRPLVDQFIIKSNDSKKVVAKVRSNKLIVACDSPVKITVEEMQPHDGGFRTCWEINFYKSVRHQVGLIEQFEDGTFRFSNDQGVSDEDMDFYEDNKAISNVTPIKANSLDKQNELDQRKNESNEEYQNRLMQIVTENGGPDFRKKAR